MPRYQLLDVALLLALNAWIAWRYSRLPLGQDEGLWLLWGFTGARPYRDHVDCKPPGIHVWYWILAKLTGRNVALVRFFHVALIGAFAVLACLLSGNLHAGLIFTSLVQSAWLFAYHAPAEQVSAGFFMLALLAGPWLAALCLGLALFFNLKLAPTAILLMLLHGWWIQLATAITLCALLGGAGYLLYPQGIKAVWYSTISVSARLVRWRKGQGQHIVPRWDAYFATPLLLIAPAALASFMARPDPILWLAAATYITTNALGRVWRPYHWIPLAAILAVAATPYAAFILAADWISNGLYLGDIIGRTRPAVARMLDAARAVGVRLRLMQGTLMVNGEYTQIYIYARKRPATPLVEQVEIRHVVPERRYDARREEYPDLIVSGQNSIYAPPKEYKIALVHPPFQVLTHSVSD